MSKTTTAAKTASKSTKPAPADALGVLHAVKAWRDEPRQGAFPHELREQLDAVCKANPLQGAPS